MAQHCATCIFYDPPKRLPAGRCRLSPETLALGWQYTPTDGCAKHEAKAVAEPTLPPPGVPYYQCPSCKDVTVLSEAELERNARRLGERHRPWCGECRLPYEGPLEPVVTPAPTPE